VNGIMVNIDTDVLGRSSLKRYATFLVALLWGVGLYAESPCPANVKSIPFRSSQRHQVIVQVSLNHAKAYDFLLDTGTQMTVVDQALAAELHLTTAGDANIAGVSLRGQSRFARIDSIEVGNHVSTNQQILVYDMNRLHNAGFAIRGLLGQDFLSQFDVFIDNTHNVLCIDDTGSMEARAKAPGNPKEE
jgi:predicted aspartyl protease